MELGQVRDYLDLSYDNIFKTAFSKSEIYVKDFIEATLDIKVETIASRDQELLSVEPKLKQMRGDVIVLVNDYYLINIEMQKNKNSSDFYRSYVYLCSLVLSQIKQGAAYDRYRYLQLYIADYDWKEDGQVIPQAMIMERTEQGLPFSDLATTKFIGLNVAKKFIHKAVKDLTNYEEWMVFVKYRHKKEMRGMIEEIKMKNKTIESLDNTLLDMEDDQTFMKRISLILDEADRKMAENEAKREAEKAKKFEQEAKKFEQETKKLEQELENQKQETEMQKQETEKQKQENEVLEKKAEKADMYKQEADIQKKNIKYLMLLVQYMKEGYSAEEAENLAKRDAGIS